MKATAKVACLLPRPYGYIRRGAVVDLDVKKWDEKEYPYLVNFELVEAAKPAAPKPKTDNDPLK